MNMSLNNKRKKKHTQQENKQHKYQNYQFNRKGKKRRKNSTQSNTRTRDHVFTIWLHISATQMHESKKKTKKKTI